MWHALKAWFSSLTPSVEIGTVADIAVHIRRLLDAPAGGALIIELVGAEDAFLQFTAGPNQVQIDHPLITPQQMARENALRETLSALGLTPYETVGSDGARFLDADCPRDAVGAAILVQRILSSLFQVDHSTQLRFVGNDLPPAEYPH